jgi:hypothetical protein
LAALGAPRVKGTTPAADEVAELAPLAWTLTWVAVIVVPLVMPRTTTFWPLVIELAEVVLVPFRYVVEDASLTVTF